MAKRRHYRIEEKQDFRRFRTEVVVASLLIVFSVVGLAYVYFDLNNNKPVVDNSQNNAILGSIESVSGNMVKYENESYEVRIPEGWKQVNNPEIIVDGVRFYPDRYQGVTGVEVGRRVDVYVDEIPGRLGVDKVVKVQSVGDSIRTVGKTSPQCYKFTSYPADQPGDDHPSEWDGITFTCLTSEYTNTLGAIENTQATGVKLDSSNGTTDYFLVFSDNGSRPDNTIFTEILNTFKAK